MSTLLGVLIAAPIVLLLVVLTRTKKQSEHDEEAREENRQRLVRLECEREARLAGYAVSWKRRGLLESKPVVIQPFKPRLVAAREAK